jgi:hypothetical protein
VLALVPRSLAVWLLILAFATANGVLREGMLPKVLPHSTAYVASGILLIACILAVSLITIPWLGHLTLVQYVLVGAWWLGLTLAFEFGFGMLLRGQSFDVMLEGYRFKDGNIWPLVLLAVAAAPLIAAYVRGLLGAPQLR